MIKFNDKTIKNINKDIINIKRIYLGNTKVYETTSTSNNIIRIGIKSLDYGSDTTVDLELYLHTLSRETSTVKIRRKKNESYTLNITLTDNPDYFVVSPYSRLYVEWLDFTDTNPENDNIGHLHANTEELKYVIYPENKRLTSATSMFSGAKKLEWIDFKNTSIDSSLKYFSSMFEQCNSLNKIICTEGFRDWCWKNQDTINLPNAMRQGGTGTWQEALASNESVAEAIQYNIISTLDLNDDSKEPIKELELGEDRKIEFGEDGYPIGWNEDTSEVGSGTWEII